jgi:hypothetical protein
MAYTFKGGKLTKVKEKERQAAYSPSSSQSEAVRSAGGGKGSGKNMEFSDSGPSDDQRKRILASQNDKSFGYFDMNTGNYVPAHIDAIDGGGVNTSGDTFKGAGLYSGLLNLAGVAPYGYNRPRTYAQAGMENRPSGVSAMVANNNVSNTPQQNVVVNELPPLDPSDADRAKFDRTRSFPNVNSPLSSEPLNNQQIKDMVNPFIEGLLQQELRPEMVDPMQMIAMLRDQEMRRRNQPPTLLS